ncbi:MAG: hypothetical protein JWP92_3712 [Caulobacter sp.]|nr:hypothetical protein [Caulobacter sp.]
MQASLGARRMAEDVFVEQGSEQPDMERPDLLVAYLVLVDRACTAALNNGPRACSAFVGSVTDELHSSDDVANQLRFAVPEVAQAERDAQALLRSRCAACRMACERAGK